MYLCTRNYDLSRGGTFETAKAGTLIPQSARNSKKIIKVETFEGDSLGYSRNMLYFCHRN